MTCNAMKYVKIWRITTYVQSDLIHVSVYKQVIDLTQIVNAPCVKAIMITNAPVKLPHSLMIQNFSHIAILTARITAIDCANGGLYQISRHWKLTNTSQKKQQIYNTQSLDKNT